jgi:regulatory protein
MVAYEIMDELVEEIIAKLKTEKFLDDERYVKAYVSDKFRLNKWGKIKIRHYLKAKGLSDGLIETGLKEIDDDQYKKVLIAIIKEKSRKVKTTNKYEKTGQIIRFAQSRGFEPEIIHRYLNEVIK